MMNAMAEPLSFAVGVIETLDARMQLYVTSILL
jgi:hypothetical protein